MAARNKFYEVQELWNNLHWNTMAYFRKKEDAETFLATYKSRSHQYPARVVEKEFTNIKDVT